ncbi:putative monocarboxylate permease [Phyllosticta citrichinensis]|uniref:Monocarboxylate permease n=1 Tax=Phyllosticta citrichinensis TaxID=1130410 RepID=A0ABR1XJY2_9PEZI
MSDDYDHHVDENTPLLHGETNSQYDHDLVKELHTERDDFPDGGRRAWSVVLGSWCAMVAAFGLLNTMGVMHAWLSSHQLKDHSYAQTGWIFSTFTFLVYFGSIQIGPLFDAHGLKWTLIPGCFGFVISLFLLSICQVYWQYMLAWGILGGTSCCLIFTPAIVSIGHWFRRRRALATSLALTAGGIGGILFPAILLNLERRIGFNNAIRVVGLICLLLCGVAVFLVKTRLSPNTKGGSGIDLLALRDKIYASTTIAIFLLELAFFIPVTYITSYALKQGLSEELSYSLVMILNAGSVVGRALSGWLADAFGRFRTIILTSGITTLLTLLWLCARDNAALVITYALAFGAASGSIIAVTPVCVAQICRTEDYGKRYGTTYFVVSFGTLIGIPLCGAILDTGRDGVPNFPGLILFSGAVFALGTFFFILSMGLATKWNFQVKF